VTRLGIFRLAGLTAVAGLIADQGSKWALLKWVVPTPDAQLSVLPVFDIVWWRNTGTSFSLFRTGAAWGPYVFSITALAIVALLVLWLWRTEKPLPAVAIGMVIGGAVGNVIDRLRFGWVNDFFFAHIGSPDPVTGLYSPYRSWPAFNVADSLIVVGVAILVLDGMFLSHKPAETMRQRKEP
jgi:signal peptidase II